MSPRIKQGGGIHISRQRSVNQSSTTQANEKQQGHIGDVYHAPIGRNEPLYPVAEVIIGIAPGFFTGSTGQGV
ncbi:hypothetical protein N7447_005840 [Penicillium robsamsonii]|uniref:uncharacterized protein n=1 Tax=Penicillium robsamsonii TaxID=1792511 RepID=UPI002548295C|nr:uncharacterized protein N7447_005840 [Penicillium robsamsonii]KAJ5823500.1 hypothetical protein N7447_005840 [Penicillium robsamsonii]